jgi:hypothetical protein
MQPHRAEVIKHELPRTLVPNNPDIIKFSRQAQPLDPAVKPFSAAGNATDGRPQVEGRRGASRPRDCLLKYKSIEGSQ